MANKKAINDMEYLASLCWPARETQRYKGWIIHWSDGITWRANSVLPLSPIDTISLKEAIEYVISFYEQRNTEPAFKITEASQPQDLDETLADMGFVKRMITHLQTVEINQLSCHNPKVPVDLLKVTNDSIRLLFYESGLNDKQMRAREEIIKRIEGEKIIARVMIDGRIAGVGLGVVEENWLGIFSIRTMEEYRRRGVGWSINCALAMWGEENDASHAFLQVEAVNGPALTLYEAMGFRSMYTYWYRILEKK